MADKTTFGGAQGRVAQRQTWTDGLPHDFKGWGPQTPDPDHMGDDHLVFAPEHSLEWSGEGDVHNHHVWRFDGRRRHHH